MSLTQAPDDVEPCSCAEHAHEAVHRALAVELEEGVEEHEVVELVPPGHAHWSSLLQPRARAARIAGEAYGSDDRCLARDWRRPLLPRRCYLSSGLPIHARVVPPLQIPRVQAMSDIAAERRAGADKPLP